MKLSYFDTRAPSYRCTTSSRFVVHGLSRCLANFAILAFRIAIGYTGADFFWPVSGTKKVKNGHTWKRREIAPGLRHFFLLCSTVVESSLKCTKRRSSYFISLYPDSLCGASPENYCEQETEINTNSKAAQVKQDKIKTCLLLRKTA